MTYSSDFRHKVLSVQEKEGLTIAQVASRFGMGVASVARWIKKPEPQKNRNKPATKIDMDALARDVVESPDAYLYERAQRLGISHALKRMGVTYKKNSAASKGKRRQTAHLPNTYKTL